MDIELTQGIELGGELGIHFAVTIIITALVAMFVLWRYRIAVVGGMRLRQSEALPVPALSFVPATSVHDETAALAWERATHQRVIVAWLLSVGVAGLLLAFVSAPADLRTSPTHLLSIAGAMMLSAAVPMIAVSLAWSWKRGICFWLALLVTADVVALIVSILQRSVSGGTVTLDQLMNTVFFLQLAAVSLWEPLLLLLVSGSTRLRGVVPITFTGLLLFGLTPFLGIHITKAMAQSREGSELLLASYNLFGLYGAFVVIALPMGWLAWQ
jgi:hypothetical protein